MADEPFYAVEYTQHDAAIDALRSIADLHSPLKVPEGMTLMGSTKGKKYCAECSPDDPYLAREWPCETRTMADEVLNNDDSD